MYTKKIIQIFSFFLLLSCSNSNLLDENNLKICVNKEINNSIKMYNKKIEFYELIEKSENILFKHENLDIGFKEVYKIEVDSLFNLNNRGKKSLQKKFNVLFDNYYFDKNNYVLYSILYECPTKVMDNETLKNNKALMLQYEMFDKYKMYSSDEIIKDWINKLPKKDFEKIVYRAPLILVIINHLYQKGNGTD